jgi:sRNA-binding regulator protein Hfq
MNHIYNLNHIKLNKIKHIFKNYLILLKFKKEQIIYYKLLY